MEKKHFLYKMYPPRSSFHLDQDEDEKKTMKQHMDYWKELTNKKNAIIYGPVFDPNGVYGMAVIEVINEEKAEDIAKGDPAVLSKICTCELIPMQVGMIRNMN
jgi:uncharacterized protein YciI